MVNMTVHGVADPLVVGVMTDILTVGTVVIQSVMNSFPFAVQVTVDLPAFSLELAGLAVFALLRGTRGLLIETLFDAVSLGIQMPLDPFAL